jgi:hypothetical protein
MKFQITALTIQQPYASMIVLPDDDDRAKRVENRSWSTTYRGPLLIHAGKGTDYLGTYPHDGMTLPFGAIVGICELADCVPIIQNRQSLPRVNEFYNRLWPWLECNEHAEGPICWVLRECRAFALPIPCNGRQNLWYPTTNILDQVHAQIGALKP